MRLCVDASVCLYCVIFICVYTIVCVCKRNEHVFVPKLCCTCDGGARKIELNLIGALSMPSTLNAFGRVALQLYVKIRARAKVHPNAIVLYFCASVIIF